MRNQADVNAQRNAYRQRERSNGVRITYPRTLDAPEVRPPQYLNYVLPRKESRLMGDEANRVNGLFLPYPLLGLILTLVLALGGGLIGIYAQVSSMNATMLMRDSDSREQIKALREENKLLSMYITDIREKVIRLEERKKGVN